MTHLPDPTPRDTGTPGGSGSLGQPRPADEARRALHAARRALAERRARQESRMPPEGRIPPEGNIPPSDRARPKGRVRPGPVSAERHTQAAEQHTQAEEPTSAQVQQATQATLDGQATQATHTRRTKRPGQVAREDRSARPGQEGQKRNGRRTGAPTASASTASASTPAAAFATTWWGRAWIAALEEAALDPARLARGRAYAERGQVGVISATPGRLLAYVQGSRPRPYRAQARLRTLSDEEWDGFLDAAAERPEHVAALLDKELPHALADCGGALLPGPDDLELHCSCPDPGRPCKHAAALCYRTARLLDEDPFVLLLLRGRGEQELVDALSRRHATRTARAARAARAAAPFPGVLAADVLAGDQGLAPAALPAPLPVPVRPGQPPAYPACSGGPDPLALDQLAADAAARAHALLTTGRDPVAELTVWQDAVRLAACSPGSGLTAATRGRYAALADATGHTTAELTRAAAAWRQGGAEGLAVLEEPWDPPAGRFDRARPALLAAGLPAFRPWHNHLTHPRGHLQLRFGRDGLWYGYESEPGRDDWWPRGAPDLDPVGALGDFGTGPVPGDDGHQPSPGGHRAS